ncbi:MAG: DUF4332 domain-containing protein [Thermoplasmatota archaeon]
MDTPPATVDAKRANLFLIVLGVGILAAAAFALSGGTIGVFPLASAIAALGLGAAALFIVDILLMTRLHQFSRDIGAANSPFMGLLAILLVGAVIAVGFAATGNQLGIFQLESAVTGLGITFAVLAIITAWLLISLQRAGVVQLFPGEEQRAYVQVPKAEEGQHILLIEGIGEKYASRLNAHGIITIPQLLRIAAIDVARKADVTEALASEWQAMARLMQVKGIGAQYAEILAMAGVHTPEALARADPDQLLARIDAVEARRKTRVLKTDIQAGHVKRFIQAAKDHAGNLVTIRNKPE